MFWNAEKRKQRKRTRLEAKYRKLEQEYMALRERCRVLEEENVFNAAVLARMRLHEEAKLEQVKKQLLGLGVTPESLGIQKQPPETARDDRNRS